MKKRVLNVVSLVLALSMLVAIITGCSKGKVADKDEQGRTIISTDAYPDKEGKDKEDYDAKVAKFEEANPDVNVEPDNWVFDWETFYAKAEGKQLPTVFKTAFTEAKTCAESGYVADITDALDKYGYIEKMNPKVKEIIDQDDKIYSFPAYSYLLCLAINTDMFEKAGLMEEDGTPMQPKTWDEVVDYAKKIKAATGKAGFVFPSNGGTGGWMFTCLAWSFGADFMEQDKDGKWKATFDSEEAANALQWVKDLKWKHNVLPANTLIDFSEYQKTYATESAAMYMTSGDSAWRYVQYGLAPEKVGMIALPAGPKRHVTLMGGTIYQVAGHSTEDQIDAGIRWMDSQYGATLSEARKLFLDTEYDKKVRENQMIGAKVFNVWNDNTECVEYENSLIAKHSNVNPNHVRLYNEFLTSDVEIQPEEPVCTQELYRTLDGCIQEVLTNENADCREVLKKANADFQANYLNNLTF